MEITLNSDEIENGMSSEDVVYDCTDGNNPGSVCQKTCAHGFIPAGRNPLRMARQEGRTETLATDTAPQFLIKPSLACTASLPADPGC